MPPEPVTVLHVIGGLSCQGGVASYVKRLASLRLEGVKSCIWMHRDFQPPAGPPEFICRGKATILNRSRWGDARVAMQEIGPLRAWAKENQRLVIHAHSRAGICAATVARWLTGAPVVIHLHTLAGQPWIYRFLRWLARAKVVYNSRKTCSHFGDDPQTASILMPGITWPEKPAAKRDRVPRFVGSGAIVPDKHFHVLVQAFQQLRMEGTRAELEIFGFSDAPSDAVHQREIVNACRNAPEIHLRNWTSDWSSELAQDDIFIHLGQPESFGIVILEAYAKGCRLIVLRDTFLDDLPPPLNERGILRLETLSANHLSQQMKRALTKVDLEPNLWDLRRAVKNMFLNESTATRLAPIYQALSQK